MGRSLRLVLLVFVILSIIISIGYVLTANGVFGLNNPRISNYPIQGVDVSHHQGEIKWDDFSENQITFAIIKATEGGDHRDKNFSVNWKEAQRNQVVVGAYHYYSFCKSPDEQFANFTGVVQKQKGMLPPAIDLEYDNNCNTAIDVSELRHDLKLFINKLEGYYGVAPILYCNEDFYFKYLDVSDFGHCRLWIRNIYRRPSLKGASAYQFWQYSSKGRIAGINGFVDLNAFIGSEKEFQNLLIP